VDAAPLLASVRGPGQGPRLVVTLLVNPVRPASTLAVIELGGVWFEELKFNKYCSTFVLFDKKFIILD
jgi:hypothetical protein